VLTDVSPPTLLAARVGAWYNDPAAGPSSWRLVAERVARITASTTDPPQRRCTHHGERHRPDERHHQFPRDEDRHTVVVKTSYFPNWHAEGANAGRYANLMVCADVP